MDNKKTNICAYYLIVVFHCSLQKNLFVQIMKQAQINMIKQLTASVNIYFLFLVQFWQT